MKTDGRTLYIDMAKTLGIFLVVAGHFLLEYENEGVRNLIYAFHMPFFFLLSGLTLKACRTLEDIKGHLCKRVAFLLLPYAVFTIIFSEPEAESLLGILYGSNRSLHEVGYMAAMWFIPCLFLADFFVTWLLYFCSKLRNGWARIAAKLAFCVVAGGLSDFLSQRVPDRGYPFSADVALTAAIFMLIGYEIQAREIVQKIEAWKAPLILALCAVSLALTWGFNYINFHVLTEGYQKITMPLSRYGNYPVFLCAGAAGSCLMILLSLLISKIYKGRYFYVLGQRTLLILGTHQVVITALEAVITKCNVPLKFITWILLSIAALLISNTAAMVIEKIFGWQFSYVYRKRS